MQYEGNKQFATPVMTSNIGKYTTEQMAGIPSSAPIHSAAVQNNISPLMVHRRIKNAQERPQFMIAGGE
jgi:hypothetical protein